MPGYRTESCTIKQSGDVEKDWLDLQQRASYSYFQSWGWIETWLNQIAIDLQPVAVKVWFDERLVGIGLFVARDIKRRIIIRSLAMYLNEYPFQDKNMVTEGNGLLAAKGYENAVYSETIGYLLKEYKQYDEFCFGAIQEDLNQFNVDKAIIQNADCIINERSISRHIDLTIFPPGIDGYLASLSKNRRGQIRRSIRLYDEDGCLQIDEAVNVTQALLYLDQLKALHSDYWRLRGESGSFSNPLWERFHRELICRRFDAGEIQLLKVSSKCGEIGYIYNIVLNKHVYVIQTGFQRNQDKRLMPGYVAHTLAIAYNSSKGMAVYDLLYGDSLYKQILCNRSRKLLWIVIQRKCLKFTVEKFAVGLVRRIRRLFSGKV